MVEGKGEFDGANIGGGEQQELYQVNSMPYTDPSNSNSGYYTGTINKQHTSLHGHGSFALDYQKLPLVGIWKDGIMIQQQTNIRLSNASKEEGVNAGDDVSVMTGVTQQVSNTSTPTSGTTNNNKPSISVPVGNVNNSSLLLDDDDNDDNEGEDMINQFKKHSSTGSNISHNSSIPPRQSARMSNPHNLSLIQEEEISRRNLLDGSFKSQRSQQRSQRILDSSNRSSSRGLENALDNSARNGRNNTLAMSVGHTAAEDYTREHDFRHSTGSYGGGHYYDDGQDEQWRKHGSQGSNNVPSYYEKPDQYIDPSAYNDDIDASHRSTVSTTSSGGQRRVSFKNEKENELRKSGKILSSNGRGLSPAQLIAQDSKSNTYLLDASGRSLAEIEALQQDTIAWGSSSSTGSTTPHDQPLDRSSSSRTPWDNDEVTPTSEQIEALNKKNRWKIIPVSFGRYNNNKKHKENKMQTLHSESITERQTKKRKYCIIALLLCMVIGGAAGVIYFLFYTKNIQEEIISDPSFNATNTTSTTTSQQPQDTLNNDDTQDKSETISELPWDDDTPCASLIISILTDKFGNETSWELFYDNPYKNDGMDNNVLLATEKRKRLRKHKTESESATSRYLSATSSISNNSSSHSNNNDNNDNMTLILQPGPYKYLDTTDPTYISNISNQYSSQICLPMGQYKFIIHDTNNNGICCIYGMGEFKGQFVNDGREVFMGDGIFQNTDVKEFEVLRDDIVASMQLPTTTSQAVDDENNQTESSLIMVNVTIPSTSPSFDPLSSKATNDTSLSTAPTPAGSNDNLSSSSNNTTTSILISIPGNLTFTYLIYPPETQEEGNSMIVVLEDTIQDVAIKALKETDEEDDDADEVVRKVVIQEVKILGINGKPVSEDIAAEDQQDPQIEDYQERYLQTAANVTTSDINSTLVEFNIILEESCEVCHNEEDFVNTTTTYYQDTIRPYMNDQVANGSLTDILQDRVKQNSVHQSSNDTTAVIDLFQGVEIVDGEFNVKMVQSDFVYTSSSSSEDSIILDLVNDTDTSLLTNATSNVTGILNTTDSSSSSSNTTVFNDTDISSATSNITTSYYNSTDNSTTTNGTDIEPSNNTSNLTTFFNDTVDVLNTTDTNSTTTFSCPFTLNQSSIINSQSTLYYEVVVPSSNTSSDANNNGIFCARLEVLNNEDGWIGIGFSPGGKMESSHAIIGVPNDGIVQKYILSGYYPGVMSDEKQTLQDTSIGIDEEDGKTVMKFAKQMVEYGETPIKNDGENILLHAWGNSMLGYHIGKLSFVLDLSDNRTEVPSSAPSHSSAPTAYNPELRYSKSLLVEGFSNSSKYGRAIDYSDGILAVGAPAAINEGGEVSGAVYLYTLDSFISNDTASAEGENATIMLPQPFNILYGVSPGSLFGNSLALSGKHLVVGARNENNETGTMRIYDIIDTDTVVMSGEFPGDRFGMSVSISGDGSVVGVSATNGLIEGVTDGGGRVTTYQYQGEEWVQYGSILEGGMDGEVSLDLSHDGTVMVIGATREEKSGHSRSAGKAAVFVINDDGTEWILRQDLFGDTKGSNDGTSVAISSDGSVLVVGGPSYTSLIDDDPKKMAGRCKVYEWDVNTSKYELIHSLLGQRKYEKIGVAAAVSDDGNIVACGGDKGRWGANHMGVSGDVRLWNRESLNSKILWPEGESRLVVDEALESPRLC